MHAWIKVAVFSLIISTFTALLVFPTLLPFSPENSGWNGLSILSSEVNLVKLTSLSYLKEVSARNYLLLIVAPDKEFTLNEVECIRDFLARGGVVVVADDFGYANDLLSKLGVPLFLNGNILADPVFRYKSSYLPKLIFIDKKLLNVSSLQLNYATFIEIGNSSSARVLAWSSCYSFVDLNENRDYDEGEPKGRFPVIVEVDFGKGKIVLIADSSVFINSMILMEDNLKLIKQFAEDKTVLLDVSHWRYSEIIFFKAYIEYILSIRDIRYIAFILIVMLIWKIKLKRK